MAAELSYPPAPLITTAGSEWINLVGIIRDAGDLLFADFTGDRSSPRIVKVEPSDLQSFAAFHRRVADELSLWVRHRSEEERTARLQARDWSDCVEAAFARGAVEGKR